jgi:hypothetical protein
MKRRDEAVSVLVSCTVMARVPAEGSWSTSAEPLQVSVAKASELIGV